MKNLLIRELDGETLILDPVADRIHRLNVTASLIWRMQRDGHEPQAIASALAREFEIDENRARQDVNETLALLKSILLVGNDSHYAQGPE